MCTYIASLTFIKVYVYVSPNLLFSLSEHPHVRLNVFPPFGFLTKCTMTHLQAS